ncbi:hypothetical protein HOD20_08195 [archaeon]|jgi:hypothetical protein|nr:hypothetical protein [archaeon]MBT4352490.1 hypothetical protein [archaeon]MBT4647189.1 hypothetical protein [archaeon]MBT6822192.1 hypothetical protein [archaeon]MBT7391733.1 hypothetical protein [archaeon]
MAEPSALRGSIAFLNDIGIYDVVLPFILVFTMIYAILEKSKVFGVEKLSDGTETTRKNLNSMFAFVTAFLVVASTQIVAAVNRILAQIILLLLLGVCILMLTGVFHTGEKEFKLQKGYRNGLTGLMIAGTIFIFLNSIHTKDDVPWLNFIYEFIVKNIDNAAFGALILMLIMIGAIGAITSNPDTAEAKRKKKIKDIEEGNED